MSSFPTSITKTTKCSSVVELLDLFRADLNGYFGCYYSSSCRFLGTDATENWDITEFYRYSKPHFDAGSAWTYIPRPSSRKIEEVNVGGGGGGGGDIQRIATFDELLDSESFVCTTRGSGSAVYEGGFWYILSYHLSFPTPNDMAEDICGKIATFEKKSTTNTALKAAAKKADEAAAQLLAELDMEEETNNKKETGKTKKKTGKGKG